MNNTFKLCCSSLSFLANSASTKWTPIISTIHSVNPMWNSVRYKQHLPIHLKPTHPPVSQIKIIEKHLGEEQVENPEPASAGKFPQTQQQSPFNSKTTSTDTDKPQVQVETDSLNGKYEVKVNFTDAPLTDHKSLKVSLEPFRESSILHIDAEVEPLDLRPHHHHQNPPHHQRISHMFSRHFRLPENVDKAHLVAYFIPEEATLIISAPLTKEIQDFKCHYII